MKRKVCGWMSRVSFCLTVALASGLMISCEGTEEEEKVEAVASERFVGTWRLVQEKGWALAGGDKDEYTEDFSGQNYLYVFHSDGRLEDRRNNRTGRWSLDGNRLTMNNEESYIKTFTNESFSTEYYSDVEYKQSVYQRVD
ncbi:MAG: lipocalin family protein [Clostridium sp.]|nr:lipocalin family protein [Clostridium sp.]